MAPQAPALRMAAGALLLLLLVTPPSLAQTPAVPTNPQGEFFQFVIACSNTLAMMSFGEAGEATCTAMDLTRDAVVVPGQPAVSAPPLQHLIFLTIRPVGTGNETEGWVAYPDASPLVLTGGKSQEFHVRFAHLPTIRSAVYEVDLLANFSAGTESPTQEKFNQTVRLVGMIRPYYLAQAQTQINDLSKKAEQNEKVTFSIDVTNSGVFPDYYTADVRSNDPAFLIAKTPGIYVPPHSTRTYTFTVLTPKGTFYEFGHNGAFRADFTSTFGGAQFSAQAFIRVTGLYLPVYWIPMTLIGLLSAVIVVRRAQERKSIRALERGAPRRVQPTPRQAVLLKELKRTDPEAYAARMAAMNAVYQERRAEYKTVAKERRAQDREEMRVARAEFKAARKKAKREAKERRTQEARERKERKILEAAEAKERKKREKELAKVRKGLEKKRGKLAKKEAKAAKKQAKVDAKTAKADAKTQAKADKAAAKEAKKQGKS